MRSRLAASRITRTGPLVVVFLVAIVAANLTLTHFGPNWVTLNAFFLIGLDLVTRDRLADFWGTSRWLKMTLLIVVGGAVSYWLNRNAATIAVASAISFCAAESVEAIAYHLLRRQRWLDRAPRAAMLGAVVDSLVFPTLAFGGFVFITSFDQFIAKFAGAVAWTWVLAKIARPPAVAPETAR